MAIIEANNISLGYDGINVVENLSFRVNKGDYLLVVGQNGSGKSTLIKALLGLKKTTGGHLHFLDIKQNAVGYLPQQTEVQKDFPASVFEVVLSGVLGKKRGFGFYSSKDKHTAKNNLEMLGIADLKNKCYRNLSGGQKQRVLLARALCAADSLLLLDEPVTGLDADSTREMYNLLYHLNRDHGITIIMVSHDIKSATGYASHVLSLGAREHFFGTTCEYIKERGGHTNA